ncbi:MAG: FAD:protein FMN transferase [Candidatus Zixiibacteriota bacterium]
MKSTSDIISNFKPWTVIVVTSLITIAGCSSTPRQPAPAELSGQTMGTEYHVKIVTDSTLPESEIQILSAAIDTMLAEINRQMSVYDENSEISAFNKFNDTDWFPVSIATSRVVAHSISVSELTSGAFDITVGPLVNLWGFGPSPDSGQIPGDEQIENALDNVGYYRLAVRSSPPAVKKEFVGAQSDLGGVAKGYGVDQIAGIIRGRGYANYLVEIGGEVCASGVNQNGVPWQVGVQKPGTDFGTVATVSLNNICMATSGDYQNYFEKDGVRYSHLIDPRTGRPITHNLASVTVIDQTCIRADALATGLNVLGPEAGWELANELGLAAQFVTREGDGFVVRNTQRFEKYLLQNK